MVKTSASAANAIWAYHSPFKVKDLGPKEQQPATFFEWIGSAGL